MTLTLGDMQKEFEIHAVPKECKLRTDGMLGRNMLIDMKATIDYGDRFLRIGLTKIPLCDTTIKVPPRAETLVQVLVNRNGDGLIEDTELEPGVYIPTTAVSAKQNKAHVVIVNTSNHEVDVRNVVYQISKLNSLTQIIDRYSEQLSQN